MPKQPKTPCPACGQTGRTVEPATLRALLTQDANERLGRAEGARFCRTPDCDVVYYLEAGEHFGQGDVHVEVFQKSSDPARRVCYCFGHTVRSIEDEIADDGRTDVAERIARACREGLDRCPETNPQGACCLGNVRQVVRERHTAGQDEASPDCCDKAVGDASQAHEARAVWSLGGALLAAILASACCWLPLAFIGAGASVVGVAGFFDAWRPLWLAITLVLLGAGFYLVYRRPACAPGTACATPRPGRQRFNKLTLWLATGLVIAFATFPSYVAALLGGAGQQEVLADDGAGVVRTYTITGMTCEGCTAQVRNVLMDVPGVVAAEVSYTDGHARVRFESPAAVDDVAIRTALAGAGYH